MLFFALLQRIKRVAESTLRNQLEGPTAQPFEDVNLEPRRISTGT